MSQKPYVSLILNYESVIIKTTAKEASFPITTWKQIPGFHEQPRPQTSTPPSAAAWNMDLNTGSGMVQIMNPHMALGNDTDQRSCARPYLLENTQNLGIFILFRGPHLILREKLEFVYL